MGWKDITPGTKKANAVAARFIQSQKGTLGVEVNFSFEENGQTERINWVGWLSPGAMENTMRTLVEVLGFNGDDEVVPGTSELKPTAIDRSRTVELVVDLESYEGRTSPRVKWVNAVGSGSAFKTLTPETVKGALSAVGFKSAYLATKKSGDVPF